MVFERFLFLEHMLVLILLVVGVVDPFPAWLWCWVFSLVEGPHFLPWVFSHF